MRGFIASVPPRDRAVRRPSGRAAGRFCLRERPLSRNEHGAHTPGPTRVESSPGVTNEQIKIAADTGWTLLTGFLVFFMNAGFGLIEAGLCQRKNTTMILSKNFAVFAIATLGFYVLGFGLMFSDGGLLGTAGGWLLGGADNSPASGDSLPGNLRLARVGGRAAAGEVLLRGGLRRNVGDDRLGPRSWRARPAPGRRRRPGRPRGPWTSPSAGWRARRTPTARPRSAGAGGCRARRPAPPG